MATVDLEVLVKETRHAFILAKADGKLEAGEVVQIAVGLASKLQKLAGLSGKEKKAVALLALRKGLAAADVTACLPVLSQASPEMKAAFEDQIVASAGAAIDLALAAAAGTLDLRKPASWKACLPICLSLGRAAVSAAATSAALKDQPVLREALQAGAAAVESAIPESKAPAAEDSKPEAGTPPPPKSDAEPSPAAST